MLFVLLSCGPKAAPASSTDATPSGWHAMDGWSGSCFFAPDFTSMAADVAGSKRRATASALALQWRGGRNDGVRFDTALVDEVEALLKEEPAMVDAVAAENLGYCRELMSGAVGTLEWGSWLEEQPDRLQAGKCVQLVDAPSYHHLEIDTTWQFPVELCAGESVRITASAQDQFRLSEDGAWLNAEGVEGEHGTDAPCTSDGALVGMLVARFGDTCFPVGLEASFTAPARGTLEVALNDGSPEDNAWREVDQVRDRISVEVAPK